MTFEEMLPGLKAKKKYVRTGWGGAENYVQLFDTIEQNGIALEVTPYFLINVSGEGEGFSMWSPLIIRSMVSSVRYTSAPFSIRIFPANKAVFINNFSFM